MLSIIHQKRDELHKIASFALIAVLFRLSIAEGAGLQRVIVFPLRASAQNDSPNWIGDGIAESISSQLNIPGIEVTNRYKRAGLLKSMNLPQGANLSRGSMIRIAQEDGADFLVLGEYEEIEKNIRIAVRVLDMKSLKLGGRISANGPISALPQLENELAWLILSNSGLEKSLNRERFRERSRKVPNEAYSLFIEGLCGYGDVDPLSLLLKSIEIHPDFPAAKLALGRLYFRRGSCDHAMKYWTPMFDGGEANLEYEFMRGTCHLQGKQPSQALHAFSRVLEFSRPAEVLNNIGVAYLQMGNTMNALSYFKEAGSLTDTNPIMQMNLAVAYFLVNGLEPARKVTEDALKRHPNNGMLQFLHAFLLKKQGETEQSAIAEEKARNLGINVDKIYDQDPVTWGRVIRTWEAFQTP
jgi:tetratricopeptide (TPR) repeat protein